MIRIGGVDAAGKWFEGDPASAGGALPGARLVWFDLEDPTPSDLAWVHSAAGAALGVPAPEGFALPEPGREAAEAVFHAESAIIRLHRIFYRFENESVERRPVLIALGRGRVVTVHRANLSRTFKNLFELVRNRSREISEGGPAQVFELLVEAILHDYKPILEDWQDTLDQLEQTALRGSTALAGAAAAQTGATNGDAGVAERILSFKKLVTSVRQALLREEKVLEAFHERASDSVLGGLPRARFRSLHLELRELIVEFEKLRELAVSVFQVYAAVLNLEISQSSHHMNRIMERLAVVTSVFMPLTFIVGVYGMNIPGIPELELPSFYFILWGVMIGIALLLLWVFKKLRWY